MGFEFFYFNSDTLGFRPKYAQTPLSVEAKQIRLLLETKPFESVMFTQIWVVPTDSSPSRPRNHRHSNVFLHYIISFFIIIQTSLHLHLCLLKSVGDNKSYPKYKPIYREYVLRPNSKELEGKVEYIYYRRTWVREEDWEKEVYSNYASQSSGSYWSGQGNSNCGYQRPQWKNYFKREDWEEKVNSNNDSQGSESKNYWNKDLVLDRLALGLSASGPLVLDDVKQAYRECALKWHPDRHEGASKADAEEKFKLCSAAYQSLCSKMEV